MTKLKTYIKLIRLKNSILTVLAVFIGALASQVNLFGNLLNLTIAFLSAFLIVAAGFVINNFYDTPWDAKTPTGREKNPIANNEISPTSAKVLALALFVCGLAAAILSLNGFVILLAGLNSFLEFAYSKWLKPIYSLTLIGNFVLSYLTGSAYLYGLVALGTFSFSAYLGVSFMLITSLLASMGREAIKSIPDLEEDDARKIGTFARRYGVRNASIIGGTFLLFAVLLSPMPFILGLFNIAYLAVVFLVDSALILLSLFLFLLPTEENAQKIKNYVLYVMGAGIIAFGLGVTQISFTIAENLILLSMIIGITPIIMLIIAVSLMPETIKLSRILEE